MYRLLCLGITLLSLAIVFLSPVLHDALADIR